MSKIVTIEIPDSEWQEMEEFWNVWEDGSFPIHAAQYFRNALIRAGYMKEEE